MPVAIRRAVKSSMKIAWHATRSSVACTASGRPSTAFLAERPARWLITATRGHSGIVASRGPEALDTFIAEPQASVPANRMPYAGMPDAADRADLISYLQKVSKSSVP